MAHGAGQEGEFVMDALKDIDKKTMIFLRCLATHCSMRLARLYGLIEDKVSGGCVDEYGVATIEVEYNSHNDVRDEIFEALYSTEKELRIHSGARDVSLKYGAREIEGVVYVAAENPYVVRWVVDIAGVTVPPPRPEDSAIGMLATLRDCVKDLSTFDYARYTVLGEPLEHYVQRIIDRIKDDSKSIERIVRDAIIDYQEMYGHAPNDEAERDIMNRAENANKWLVDHDFEIEPLLWSKEEVPCL